jgi:hypothetical protein
MKLTSTPEQTTMVGEGAQVSLETESAANWSVRSLYCNWKPHAILCTPTDSFFFSFYLELHEAAFDSAVGLLPLDLLAMEFTDSIDCEKTRIKCVARKYYATLP